MAEALRRVPAFARLPDTLLHEVAERAESVSLAAGEWLFREGDPGDSTYVVQVGRLEAVGRRSDGSETSRTIGRGGVVGELSLLTGGTRSLSVRARRASELIALRTDALDALLAEAPGFAAEMTRELARRLVASVPAAGAGSEPPPAVLAIAGFGPPGSARDLAERLSAQLGAGGEDPPLVLAGAPGGTGHQPELAAAESAGRRMLLVADPADPEDPWLRTCLRECDRLVVLAGGGIPAWAASERALRGCDLVAAEGCSSRWNLELEPRIRYEARGPGALDRTVERIARRLQRRAVRLVLSGGGARALVHIGAIEALERAGIDVDAVGGCSMGAFIGALLARGASADEIHEVVTEEWVRRSPIGDYALPLVAIMRGVRGTEMLLRVFGQRQIEDLDREYFCVASDILHHELVVHRRGWLARAVGSSIALPAIVPPVPFGRHMLVDGGVLDNLPVAAMAERDEGPIIAVDATLQLVYEDTEVNTRSRFHDARAKLSMALTGVPNLRPRIQDTIIRTMTIGSLDTTIAARRHAQLVITPSTPGVGMFQFERIGELREIGRAAAEQALAATQVFAAPK
jgi:predicted acylesterase/phospholipase RssA/CRP-like cAMP-binding protein